MRSLAMLAALWLAGCTMPTADPGKPMPPAHAAPEISVETDGPRPTHGGTE